MTTSRVGVGITKAVFHTTLLTAMTKHSSAASMAVFRLVNWWP
ncbi:hypothetical protein DFP85_110106 [Halomonas ventosae]|uniref:Uncharacterized protein n=1 Tax=Halomonas ventosae TaxID=229007 RepID=A0A4R6ZKX7_9GAMM|nr:hypothetical protein [Halomonas ventosae]TDR53040.1 hypothetical protein DFP85_110106 [Halomonas ventosae]